MHFYTFLYIYIYTLWIQTLSEKVLNPPNYSKLYPKHFLRRYLDPMIYIYMHVDEFAFIRINIAYLWHDG